MTEQLKHFGNAGADRIFIIDNQDMRPMVLLHWKLF
jgi:hypothetical protein